MFRPQFLIPSLVNARFWQWHNDGWVKLTLKPGQHLHTSTFRRTDEGWSRDYNDWTLEDGIVESTYCNESLDCDGRHSYASTIVCKIDRLALHHSCEPMSTDYHDGELIRTAAWVLADSEQRDQFAKEKVVSQSPLISANDMFLNYLTTALSQHDDVTKEFMILELLRAVVQLSDELTSDDDMGDLGIVAFDAIVDAALATIRTAISATR